MATYCYRCRDCGATGYMNERVEHPNCPGCPGTMSRDYRAENVGVTVFNLQMERELGGKEGMKRHFLPHNDDFKGPGDPDGTKGMREWRDTHPPRETNKRPDWPGYVEKKVY